MHFSKYHGTGNDFIMIDGIKQPDCIAILTEQVIQKLCDRHFGIGADGLIILANSAEADFEMIYFNSDGRPSSMCGNGGRCIVKFAADNAYIDDHCEFMAIDGLHEATIDKSSSQVSLKMIDIPEFEIIEEDILLDSGSPHYVRFVDSLEIDNFNRSAQGVRYNERFAEKGVNVNFVVSHSDCIQLRTYERGVEDETLSCGTGVVASAVSAYLKDSNLGNQIDVQAVGGDLKVRFDVRGNQFSNVWLIGPAASVFDGDIELPL